MSARKTDPGKWTEEGVESLLVDFFQHEMPRNLPQLATSRTVPSQSDRERRSAGYKGLGVAACALLLAVTALSPTGQRLLSPDAPIPNNGKRDGFSAPPRVNSKDANPNSIAKKVQLPPAILKVLPRGLRTPPELQVPFNYGSPVDPSGSEELDIWDLLEIEVHPISPGTTPDGKRPRVPEEGP